MVGVKNQIKTALLLGILTVLLLFIGGFFGRAGLTIAFIFVLVMNLITYFFSDKIVLMIYRAKEAKVSEYSQLHKIVKEVCDLSKIPKPRVYIIPSRNLNAFATGRNPKHAAIAFTEGILSALNKDESRGVTAHEISHVKNRDILISTIASTIAGVISYAAMMARFGIIFGGRDDRNTGNIISLLVLSILAPLIALVLQLAISRSREYLADETGAKTIKNPLGFANALDKLEKGNKHNQIEFGSPATSSLFIVNPFKGSGLVHLFSTHPSIHDRIRRLKEMKT